MKKAFTTEIFLPSFWGFYETMWSPDWDLLAEDLSERGITLIDDWRISDNYYRDLAIYYTAQIGNEYRTDLGIDIHLDFSELVRPNEYNFSTDKIYAKLTCDDQDKFVERINELIKEHYNSIGEIIKDNHQCYSGFISFMSADVNDWIDCWLSDERYLSHVLYYLLICERKKNGFMDCEDVDYTIADLILSSIYAPSYAYPATDAAKAELKEVELRECQEEALEKYQYKMVF